MAGIDGVKFAFCRHPLQFMQAFNIIIQIAVFTKQIYRPIRNSIPRKKNTVFFVQQRNRTGCVPRAGNHLELDSPKVKTVSFTDPNNFGPVRIAVRGQQRPFGRMDIHTRKSVQVGGMVTVGMSQAAGDRESGHTADHPGKICRNNPCVNAQSRLFSNDYKAAHHLLVNRVDLPAQLYQSGFKVAKHTHFLRLLLFCPIQPTYRFFQSCNIHRIRVSDCPVKIIQHPVTVLRRFHRLIPLADCVGHLTLTNKTAQQPCRSAQVLPHIPQNLPVIRIRTAKPGSPKQEKILWAALLQKVSHPYVTAAPVGPESGKNKTCMFRFFDRLISRLSIIQAVFLRQHFTNCLGKLSCISGPAAVYDQVFHMLLLSNN